MVWWKIVLIGVGGFVCLFVVVNVIAGLVLFSYRKPHPPKPETLKPEAGPPLGKAMIVYQPGGSDYCESVAQAIGAGLRGSGWEVHLDRANEQTAADLGGFDLLCVGSPVWMARPHPPVLDYIGRCEGLKGKKAAAFATAGQDPTPGITELKSLLEKNGAVVVDSLGLLVNNRGKEADTLAEEFGKRLAGAAAR